MLLSVRVGAGCPVDSRRGYEKQSLESRKGDRVRLRMAEEALRNAKGMSKSRWVTIRRAAVKQTGLCETTTYYLPFRTQEEGDGVLDVSSGMWDEG